MEITQQKKPFSFKLSHSKPYAIVYSDGKNTMELVIKQTESEGKGAISQMFILFNILCQIPTYIDGSEFWAQNVVIEGGATSLRVDFEGIEYRYSNDALPQSAKDALVKDKGYMKNFDKLKIVYEAQFALLREKSIKPLGAQLPDIEQESQLNEVVTIVEPLKQPEPQPQSNQKVTEKEPSILDMINGYVSIIGNDKLSINERGEANLKLSILLFRISDILRQLKEAENDADAEYRAVKLEKFKEFRKICEMSEKGEKYSNEAAKTYAENETLHLKDVLNKCEAAVMYYRNIKSDIENTIKSAITVISTEKATNNNQSNKQV